jgi:hypothetical protein
MSSAPSDAIELGRRRTLAQLRRCFYGQHRVGVIAALGLRKAIQYGAALQEEAWRDAPVLHGDRLGAQVRGRHHGGGPRLAEDVVPPVIRAPTPLKPLYAGESGRWPGAADGSG